MTEQYYDPYTCKVCYNTYDEPRCFKCGHTFCKRCTITIFDTTKKCPICNTKLKKKEYQVVYDLIKPKNAIISTSIIEIEKLTNDKNDINQEIKQKEHKLQTLQTNIEEITSRLNDIRIKIIDENNSIGKQLKLVKYFIKTGFTVLKNAPYTIYKPDCMELRNDDVNSYSDKNTMISFYSRIHGFNPNSESIFNAYFREFNDLSKQMKIILLTYYSTRCINRYITEQITDNERIIDGIYIQCIDEMDMNIIAENLDMLNIEKN